MKVLFISSGNAIDGISPIVKRQGESIRAKGIELQYFTINGKGIFGYLSNYYKLRLIIKEFQPDILHAHYSSSAYLALIARGVQPLVTSLMGDDILGSRSHKGNITILSKLVILFNAIVSKFLFDFTIVKSNQMAENLFSCKNAVVPNGVNLEDAFYPIDKSIAIKKLGLNSSNINILFLSNPSRLEKNFKLAQDSVEILRARGYGVNLHQIYNESTEKLNQYYNASDILLLTSFHEGSPNVVKEAMACNLPIVSTNVGDVEWLFGNLEGCYLTTYESNNIADNLVKAISYSILKGRTQGRDRLICLGLDSESTANRIINIYQLML
jgi:teichuronic acid biosynthesis glycosyltransferase TuaC